MPELTNLPEIMAALFVGASTVLLTAGIAWRLAVRPTVKAILELREARGGGDPQLARRVKELEDEVRALRDRVEALPETSPSRLLGAEVPWRGTKEKA
jgi:hypothetical protein